MPGKEPPHTAERPAPPPRFPTWATRRPASTKANDRSVGTARGSGLGAAVGRYACALLILLVLCPQASAAADGIEFKRIALTLSEDGRILLDADIGYDLNATILEALENGVPLTFETHVQMRPADAWIWESDTVEHRLRTVLRYRPLSGLYELRNLQGDERLAFATREAALRTLGKIVAMPVVERSLLELDADYLVSIKVRLDIESLPLPMRPRAYLSRDWSMSSEPWEWRLRP